MKLTKLRLSNFQSFSSGPTEINLASVTYLLGPNGSGKTAVLQALSRLFGFERSMRAIRRTDFHVSPRSVPEQTLRLWIEAHFEFPELRAASGQSATIPSNFTHMKLLTADGIPCVRIRLAAEMDADGEIEEECLWVLETDASGEPTRTSIVSRSQRNSFHVHYLPARRDPADHVSYAATTLLGRALRAANWAGERDTISNLSNSISQELANNAAIAAISAQITASWVGLHKGHYYSAPSISFISGEFEQLMRHLSIGFSPGESETTVDFSRLSDGQKSLLYFSLVLAMQAIGRKVLRQETAAFDIDKLRPAVFTLIALEEPENSLSPHYLGRILRCLREMSSNEDAQAVVATHSPSVIRRVPPEDIRYLRLDPQRATAVSGIVLPPKNDEAHKFVREAVQAYPELYFFRLVVLGEGDSEEIVLQRLLQAHGIGDDESSISIVPLGGRHVNHFWRLLWSLGIPHLTLLDLDLARFGGGWGRVHYASRELQKYLAPGSVFNDQNIGQIPGWNAAARLLEAGESRDFWISHLELNGVYFSSPLDLDFAMLSSFPDQYLAPPPAARAAPDDATLKSVLGKSHSDPAQYSTEQLGLFVSYHSLFKVGSKPAAHLSALINISNESLRSSAPLSLTRLAQRVQAVLAGLPE